MTEDHTALSWWFPKIEAAGVPVPRTKIIQMPPDAQRSLWECFGGEPGTGDEKAFLDDLKAAATAMGFPCFLRTDHTSDKHSWENTCFLKAADDVPQHVYNLAESSEIMGGIGGIVGLPWDVWVVREFLPTMPLGVCPVYGNMPLCREFRFFVDDGKVICKHPYWPREALEQGGVDEEQIDLMVLELSSHEKADGEKLRLLAEKTGQAVPGAWSIDILETRNGWYVTDLAEAHKSFHWDDCPMKERFKGKRHAVERT